jgi:hypothetical protein
MPEQFSAGIHALLKTWRFFERIGLADSALSGFTLKLRC